MAMAVKLFELKRLSSGMAARLVGMPRADFLMQLHESGVAMIDLEEQELETDVQNA
jgi:predicted HTH domain antitoxin